MISGFGSSSTAGKHHHFSDKHHMLALPMPFSIPKVLHNFIFEDIDLKFDLKQQDIYEALKFTYISLIEFTQNFEENIASIKDKIRNEPDNQEIKNELKDIQLEMQEMNFEFKDLLEVMLEMLHREQIEELLRYSKILV